MLEKYSLIYQDYEEINTPEQLKIFLDRFFTKKWDELVDNSVFFGFYVIIFRSEELRKKFVHLHDKLRIQFEEIIIETKEKGISFQEDSHQVALQIYDIIDGWFYMSNIKIESESLEKSANRCKKLVYDLLGIA